MSRAIEVNGHPIVPNSDLRKVNLRGGNLSHANLSGCDLSGVDLRETNLEKITIDFDTKFSDAILGAQQRNQIEDAKKRLLKTEQESPVVSSGYFKAMSRKDLQLKTLEHAPFPKEIVQTIANYMFLTHFSEAQHYFIKGVIDCFAKIDLVIKSDKYWTNQTTTRSMFGSFNPPTLFAPVSIQKIREVRQKKDTTDFISNFEAIQAVSISYHENEQGFFHGDEHDDVVDKFCTSIAHNDFVTLGEFASHVEKEEPNSGPCCIQ